MIQRRQQSHLTNEIHTHSVATAACTGCASVARYGRPDGRRCCGCNTGSDIHRHLSLYPCAFITCLCELVLKSGLLGVVVLTGPCVYILV